MSIMKKLCLTLLTIGITLPLPVLANEAWLVILHGVEGTAMGFGSGKVANSDSSTLATIPMKTMKGCMEEGRRWASSPSPFRKGLRDFQCIEVK